MMEIGQVGPGEPQGPKIGLLWWLLTEVDPDTGKD